MEIIEQINEEVKAQIEQEKNIEIPEKLTPEQEQKIKDWWNNSPKDSPLKLKDAVDLVFPGCDGRNSKLARLVKQFLAKQEIKVKPSQYIPSEVEVNLSPEQKEYIVNNVDKMTSFEIAKTLFPDIPRLAPMSKHSRVIQQYIGTLENVIKYKAPNEAREGNYRPPKSLAEAANKVNQYIRNGIDLELVKKDKKLQECLNTLIKFCHSHHFILNIDNFTSSIDKNLFEGRFIAYTWDKPDLTEEEVDAYILLCSNIVSRAQSQRQKDNLNIMIESQMDEKDGKVYMAMVEMINGINKNIDECEKRQDKLRKDLNGLRTDRIDLRTRENQSVLQLVEAWKDEEKRLILLGLAEKRKQVVRDEIKKIETLDQFKAEIYGIDPEDFN